jgi:outer membrane lipoprotein-sorting protein
VQTLLVVAVLAPVVALAQQLDARAIVKLAEDAIRGDTAEMKATMHITTPRWERTLVFRSWDDSRNDRSFTRILAPRKDKGTGFLRDGTTMWMYLPRVERTTRIPPSMMLQSWMGSDFTNDDVARDSSLVDDYTAKALEPQQIEGTDVLGVVLIPHPDAPVVWAKIEAWITAEPPAPFLFLYYDEDKPGEFELIRRMRFSDVRRVDGRNVPHQWTMEPLDKPGHTTAMTLNEIAFDRDLKDSIFTQSNLKRSEAAR